MKKIIIIGSPGAGKSTFARSLANLIDLPIYYLDMIWHKPDQSNVTKDEFDHQLKALLEKECWIIDGNYNRTLEMRIEKCDTIFFLDYPLEVCLDGIKSRIGTHRIDMPWQETHLDEEFKQYVIDFPETQLPRIYEIIDRYHEQKEIFIFKDRLHQDQYLNNLKKELNL